MKGRLFLVPAALSEQSPADQLPVATLEEVFQLRYFVAERAKTARRYLKALGMPVPISELHIAEMNKHGADDVIALLKPGMDGHDIGLISEAGVPGVADPGEHIIRAAHMCDMEVVPLVGPSSLLMAIMAAGMNGQKFSFHGYLPREQGALVTAIRNLAAESRQKLCTQMFIETPYRNEKIWSALLKSLDDHTWLGIAQNLLAPDQYVRTKMVKDWRKDRFTPAKLPAVFIIYSGD